MVSFWALVIGLVTFVFCRLYCPGVDISKTTLSGSPSEGLDEIDEVT